MTDIGIVVPRKDHRDLVSNSISQHPFVGDMAKGVKARQAGEAAYDPALEPNRPICILTAKGCKGLECRTVHGLFAGDLRRVLRNDNY